MSLFSEVKSFVLAKFWAPATGAAPGYNIFNTSVYALGFALAAAYLGYPFLQRLGIELDRDFFIGITPFIFFGGAVRVLEDLGLVDSFLLVTPFIYVVIFGFTAVSLVASRKLEEHTQHSYHGILGGIGVASLVILGAHLAMTTSLVLPLALLTAVGIIAAISVAGYFFLDSFYPSLLNYSFTVPILAHYWDAATSFVAITNGASEKHVLADSFVQMFGPTGMFLMKTLVIVPVVYYIYNADIERREKRYYLFLVALLGIALGTRNILSLVLS